MPTRLTDIELVDYLNGYDFFKPEIKINASEIVAEVESPGTYLRSVFLTKIIEDTNREFYISGNNFIFNR